MDFVQKRLPALCEAFAQTPLMRLRVTTAEASVTLEKSATHSPVAYVGTIVEPRRQLRPHDYVPDPEPGRAITTVAADVVGVFHSAPDLPEIGERVDADRVLGFIEALKVRTPVKAGIAGELVGQVAEEGQPVDFGETLFVVDGGPAEAARGDVSAVPAAEEIIEPPRL